MCVSVRVYTHGYNRCPQRPEASYPLEQELQMILSHMVWWLELNSGPLQEPNMLVTDEPSTFPPTLKNYIYLWDEDMENMYGGQKTAFGSWFSPPTTWYLQFELRWSGLAASTFSCWSISLSCLSLVNHEGKGGLINPQYTDTVICA